MRVNATQITMLLVRLLAAQKAGKKTPAESLEMPYFACVF
jgi:hypothetical protein